jgi:hypothetical protein
VTTPAYACTTIWQPAATAEPTAGATPRLGYVQDDMGRGHIPTGQQIKYTYCPPASGRHYNATGAGPLKPGVYGPDDRQIPPGWVHNLEHGGLVILYRCQAPAASGSGAQESAGDGCTDAAQQAMKQLYDEFPASPVCNVPPHLVGPVIARFDDMAWPYAAILWDQVLPLQTFDKDAILAFFAQQGERTNPEQQCVAPSPSPVAGTAAPSVPASASPEATAPASSEPASSVTPSPS